MTGGGVRAWDVLVAGNKQLVGLGQASSPVSSWAGPAQGEWRASERKTREEKQREERAERKGAAWARCLRSTSTSAEHGGPGSSAWRWAAMLLPFWWVQEASVSEGEVVRVVRGDRGARVAIL